jgi:hypothetical protein
MEYDTMADPDHLASMQDTKVIVSFMSLEMRLDCVDLVIVDCRSVLYSACKQ